jgi:hypothetical protein
MGHYDKYFEKKGLKQFLIPLRSMPKIVKNESLLKMN